MIPAHPVDGLDRLTPADYDRLQTANALYRQRFDFPFLFAVRGRTQPAILAALEAQLDSTWEAEFEAALVQVFRIAGFRLQDTVE